MSPFSESGVNCYLLSQKQWDRQRFVKNQIDASLTISAVCELTFRTQFNRPSIAARTVAVVLLGACSLPTAFLM